jgi:hypothetical protein
MANANNATGALAVVAPYVTSIDAVRPDYKNVSLKDIPKAICVEDIEKIRTEFMLPRLDQCMAANRNGKGGLKNEVHRCRGTRCKGSDYCTRHNKRDLAHKKGANNAKRVVKFEEASTSETLSSSACISLDDVTP